MTNSRFTTSAAMKRQDAMSWRNVVSGFYQAANCIQIPWIPLGMRSFCLPRISFRTTTMRILLVFS